MNIKFEFRSILALIIVIGSFAFLFAMMFIKVPNENEALINVVSGAVLVAGMGAVISFYYGSSKSNNEILPTGSPTDPLNLAITTAKTIATSYYSVDEDKKLTVEEYDALPPEEKVKYNPLYE